MRTGFISLQQWLNAHIKNLGNRMDEKLLILMQNTKANADLKTVQKRTGKDWFNFYFFLKNITKSKRFK